MSEVLSRIKELITDSKEKDELLLIKKEKMSISDLFEEKKSNINGYILTKILDAFQGVTTGGAGSTEIFGSPPEDTKDNCELVFKSIMGRNIYPYEIEWSNDYCIFPYRIDSDDFVPAFNKNGRDVLNFNKNFDSNENGKTNEEKLLYRIAKNLVDYPRIAEYLFSHYDNLSKRKFEGKTMFELNKEWYEYHRNRTPEILQTPKIVCRRLMKEPSFAIDDVGYIPKDSVVCFTPRPEFKQLLSELEKMTGDKLSIIDGYNYILSYLNSEWFGEILEAKRAKKRGGYPRIGERMLDSIVIPSPKTISKKEVIKRIGK